MQNANTLLEDIGAEIGYTATSALCGWWGGRKLFVPLTTPPDHDICKVIGPAAFTRLVAAFGGTAIFIPKDRRQALIRRDRIIHDLVLRGEGAHRIGARVNLSSSFVYRIRRDLEASGLLPLILTANKVDDGPR